MQRWVHAHSRELVITTKTKYTNSWLYTHTYIYIYVLFIATCLSATNHYLNQCCCIFRWVLLHLPMQLRLQLKCQWPNYYNTFVNDSFHCLVKLPLKFGHQTQKYRGLFRYKNRTKYLQTDLSLKYGSYIWEDLFYLIHMIKTWFPPLITH